LFLSFLGIFLKSYTPSQIVLSSIKRFIYFLLQINSIFILIQLLLFKIFNYEVVFPWYGPSSIWPIFRPSGLFSEPSHFAEFFLLYLIMFDIEFGLKDLIVILGLAISTSLLGFFSIFLYIALFLVRGRKRSKIKLSFLISLLIIILIGTFFNQYFFTRLSLLYSDNSFKLRFLKFFYVGRFLDFRRLLIGFGFGNSGLAMEYYHGPYEFLFNQLPSYFSGIGNNVLMAGLLTSIILELFIVFIFTKVKGKFWGTFLYFVFLVIRLIADINFTMLYFWLVLYILVIEYYTNSIPKGRE